MKIPKKTPVLLYNYQYKQYGARAEIILVSREYYWFGNDTVGYWDDDGNIVYWNIRYVEHVTHVVPYDMKNTNHGKYIMDSRNGYKRIDTNFFVDNKEWKDFEKENIE